jgi:hypothetical protein
MAALPRTAHSLVVTVVILDYVDGKSRLLPCLRHILAQKGLPPNAMDVLVIHNPRRTRTRRGTTGRRCARR